MRRADNRSDGRYVLTRDLATYAITKEVEAGRGSPAGGAYLSFQHLPEAEIRQRLRARGGPAGRQRHRSRQTPGGSRADRALSHGRRAGRRGLQARVPGLYACGEAVGGANGANRLSGNAITEAFVFGARAGRNAAQRALQRSMLGRPEAAVPRSICCAARKGATRPIWRQFVAELKALMADMVGPFRTEEKLRAALEADRAIENRNRRSRTSSAAASIPCWSTGWTCATCCWWRNPSLCRRSRAPRAAARISGKIIRVSMTPGASISSLPCQDGKLELSRSAPSTGRAAA
jgi:succinate dehydrogenase / fumarate reductase flavoprotein subunit